MNNALGVLGLAKKAGLLEIGEESVNAASKKGKAWLILSASDASDASKRHAGSYADYGGCDWVQLEFTKNELAAVIGRGSPGMIAITDAGLARSFILKLGKPELDPIVERLSEDIAAQLRRKQKSAEYKRNNRTGKGRTEK